MICWLTGRLGKSRIGYIADMGAAVAGRDGWIMRPRIEEAPWGADVMTVIDPSGSRIRCNEQREDSQAQTSSRPA